MVEAKVPRVVGGKKYCALHGLAHLDDIYGTSGCPKCVAPKVPQRTQNIVLVSKKMARPGTGSGAMPFIGEVISVYFTGNDAEIAAETRRLKDLHGIR